MIYDTIYMHTMTTNYRNLLIVCPHNIFVREHMYENILIGIVLIPWNAWHMHKITQTLFQVNFDNEKKSKLRY